jgi:hypothetical protein
MRARVFGCAVLCSALLASCGGPSAAGERVSVVPGAPVIAFRQQVRTLWENEQFGELEKIAEESRASKSRCSDGYWQLSHLYETLRRRDEEQTRQMWLEILDKAQRWAAAKPRSTTAKVVLAGSWVGYAFYSRGSTQGNTPMSEDERALFLERLGKARAVLDEAEKLPVSDPHLFLIRQFVARGEGWSRERYEELFRKATRLEPTYHSYYYEKTVYLLPEWYGRAGDLAAFAAEAADATQAQEGDAIYAMVAIGAYFGTLKYAVKNIQFFEQQGFSWPRTKKGFEDSYKRYPGSLSHLNCYAQLACVARDKETTRIALDRLGANYIRGYWPNEGLLEECRDWARENAPAKKGWLESVLQGERPRSR